MIRAARLSWLYAQAVWYQLGVAYCRAGQASLEKRGQKYNEEWWWAFDQRVEYSRRLEQLEKKIEQS